MKNINIQIIKRILICSSLLLFCLGTIVSKEKREGNRAANILLKATEKKYIHPGILHTQESLDRIKLYVDNQTQPMYQSFLLLKKNPLASSSYQMKGPFKAIARDGIYGKTKSSSEDDHKAAYLNALMWICTQKKEHAQKTIEILNAYARKLKQIGPGTNDDPLCASFQGSMLVNAAELIRYTYPEVNSKDLKKWEEMFRKVFIPILEDFFNTPPYTNGNWGAAAIKTFMAFGVYLDDPVLYNQAVTFFYQGNDNGSLHNYISATGQCQESGRDQDHCMLGLGLLAEACEISYNQGDKGLMYEALDNRLMKGYEYTAKYNLGYDVPFVQWTDITGKYSDWAQISTRERGNFRSVFEIAYNHYVRRKGLKMPWTKIVIEQFAPEGEVKMCDHPGFGTLLFRTPDSVSGIDISQELNYCHQQIEKSLAQFDDRISVPRTIESDQKKWEMVSNLHDWISGFWPGILWYDYENTQDSLIRKRADEYTELLRSLSQGSSGHDIGFQMMSSFGQAYRLTKDEKYKKPLLESAEWLAKLYNPKVGTILSWPSMVKQMGWPHNTIIDNMMNLELLFWAAKNGGNPQYYDMALTHALTTKKYHFREDGSCFHVAVYDTLDGHFIKGVTHQGYSDTSMWARGQSWAIYGYTMVYRETHRTEFLEMAQKAADIYLKRLPADYIPYWDFDAPDIPNAPKDASAAAVTASGLLELSTYVKSQKESEKYKRAAIRMLESLSSSVYQSRETKPSFLLHSTGHYPTGSEIDVSIIYADYYYIEALIRLQRLNNGQNVLAETPCIHAMHPSAQINYVKQQIATRHEPIYSAYLQLIHYTDSILDIPHHAIADFSVPGFYDFPEEHRTNSLALQKDAFAAYSSALAYCLSGESKYGEKACYLLNAWSHINRKYSEHDGPLVMVYSGTALLMAAELMGDKKIWKEQDKDEFKKWVTSVYKDASDKIRTHPNNWGDWGRLGALLSASFLNDTDEIQKNIELIKADLPQKIKADGSMPKETKREVNGIWYTYFSLAPMTASFWIIYNLTGENLFAWQQGATSIKKALDYLVYYNQYPEKWQWYKHPNTGNPGTWPDNLQEAVAQLYNEPKYTEKLQKYRPIYYPVHHFAWSFPTLMPSKFNY